MKVRRALTHLRTHKKFGGYVDKRAAVIDVAELNKDFKNMPLAAYFDKSVEKKWMPE